MSCGNCYLSNIEDLLQKSRETLLLQADPLRDIGPDNKGRLELHNAYIMLLTCQSRGCDVKEYFNKVLSVDYIRMYRLNRGGL